MKRLLILLAVTAACADTTAPPADDPASTLTLDASAGWVYVDLDADATVVTPANPATSTDWDIAFNATRVMLNGGAAGAADVKGFCVCQNTAASDAAVQAMTAAGELADFEAVQLAAVPTDPAAWVSDALDPAIEGWYSYNFVTHVVTPDPTRVWKVRGAGSSPAYAKLHVTGIADATQSGARVTVEYAVQPDSGVAFEPPVSIVLDGRTGPAYLDIETGAGDADTWDLMLDGFTLRINGGVSGNGGAGAVLAEQSFEAMTDASDAPSAVYRADAFGGVFVEHPWYRYNLDNNHTIFPTFDVYVIDTGAGIYRVQIISYYDIEGRARHVTFRYARIDA